MSLIPRTVFQELWRLKITKGGRILFEVAVEYDEESRTWVEMIRLWVSAANVFAFRISALAAESGPGLIDMGREDVRERAHWVSGERRSCPNSSLHFRVRLHSVGDCACSCQDAVSAPILIPSCTHPGCPTITLSSSLSVTRPTKT